MVFQWYDSITLEKTEHSFFDLFLTTWHKLNDLICYLTDRMLLFLIGTAVESINVRLLFIFRT